MSKIDACIILLVVSFCCQSRAYAECPPILTGSWIQDLDYMLDNKAEGDIEKRQLLGKHITQPLTSIDFHEDGTGIYREHSHRVSNTDTHEFQITYQLTIAEDETCLITIGSEVTGRYANYGSTELRGRGSGFCIRAHTDFEYWDCYIPSGP